MALSQGVITSPVVVGRASTMEQLRRCLDVVQGGSTQTVLLTGEAGIGKSRVVREVARHARSRDFIVVQGDCFPNDLQCPFAPLLDLLRSDLAVAGEPARKLLVHERFTLLTELFRDTNLSEEKNHPEQEKRRLFMVLANYLTQRASTAPLLCIVEDVHWCDDVSLEFLYYFTRRTSVQPILLLITFRDDEMTSALTRFLAHLDKEHLAREFNLAPLTQPDVETMLTTIFEPSAPLRHEFVVAMHRITEGNPFFIEEILRSLPENDTLDLTRGDQTNSALLQVPRSIHAAVQRRLEGLSVDAHRLVTLASVIGREFDFALIEQLCATDELYTLQGGAVSDARLLTAIKLLVAAQIIVELTPDRYAFRHALTRQAVYATLLSRERREVHGRIGATIEQMYAGGLESHLVDLALHFQIASKWDKCWRYAAIAAERAFHLHLPGAAVAHFGIAIEALEHLRQTPPPAMLIQRGRAWEMLGDFDAAHSDLVRALDLAIDLPEPNAEWESLRALGFLWSSRDYATAGEYYRRALAVAHTLDSPAVLARSLNSMGNWHANANEDETALVYHQRALDLFTVFDDEAGLAETCDLLAMARFLAGDLVQSRFFARNAIERYRRLDDQPGVAACLVTMVLTGNSLQSDTLPLPSVDAEDLPACSQEAIRIARENDLRGLEAFCLASSAFLYAGRGDYAIALPYIEQARAIAQEIRHHQWTILSCFASALIAADLFALDTAHGFITRALEVATACNAGYWQTLAAATCASILVQMGKPDAARAMLDAIQTGGIHRGIVQSEVVPTSVAARRYWATWVELALLEGDAAEALHLCAALERAAAGMGEVVRAPRVTLLYAEALTALGRHDEAATLLADLIAQLEAIEGRALLWRAQRALGALQQTRTHTPTDAIAFAAARNTVQEIAENIRSASTAADAPAFLATFLAATDARIPPPPASAVSRAKRQPERARPGGLTTRELEVARLVEKGISNREIADVLVLSERTVESHVGNILHKLGFVSRTQIAAWVAKSGLSRS